MLQATILPNVPPPTMWPDFGIKIAQLFPKEERGIFQNYHKIVKYFGYLCKKFVAKNIFEKSQSGHTAKHSTIEDQNT